MSEIAVIRQLTKILTAENDLLGSGGIIVTAIFLENSSLRARRSLEGTK
jgi:hypothetical protein